LPLDARLSTVSTTRTARAGAQDEPERLPPLEQQALGRVERYGRFERDAGLGRERRRGLAEAATVQVVEHIGIELHRRHQHAVRCTRGDGRYSDASQSSSLAAPEAFRSLAPCRASGRPRTDAAERVRALPSEPSRDLSRSTAAPAASWCAPVPLRLRHAGGLRTVAIRAARSQSGALHARIRACLCSRLCLSVCWLSSAIGAARISLWQSHPRRWPQRTRNAPTSIPRP